MSEQTRTASRRRTRIIAVTFNIALICLLVVGLVSLV
jgi:hypothetical protein